MKPGRHICTGCNHIYEEPDSKHATANHDVPFEQLPDNWKCPSCGGSKDNYQPCSCVTLEAPQGKVERCEVHGEEDAH